MLLSEPHLRSAILVQSSQECLVLHRRIAAGDAATLFARAEDLREPDVPGWVPVQVDVWPNDKQEIWFRFHQTKDRGGSTQIHNSALTAVAAVVNRLRGLRDNVAKFTIDQFNTDIVRGELTALRHLGQGLCQINESLPTVRGREEE